MTGSPFQFTRAGRLHSMVSKIKPSTLLEKEPGEPQDIVNIAAGGKKKQILAQARNEVLERIKEAMRDDGNDIGTSQDGAAEGGLSVGGGHSDDVTGEACKE